jgi:hypothetical protein
MPTVETKTEGAFTLLRVIYISHTLCCITHSFVQDLIVFSKKLPRVSNGFEIDVASDQLSAQPHNSHSNSEKKTSHNIE